MSNEMSDLERRCYVAACKVSPRGFAPSRDIVRAVLAEARNPDAVQSATEEREAVAHAIELCATPYISEALADAALSALAPIRAAEILAAERERDALREALAMLANIAEQYVLEVDGAQKRGASWYTQGASGLYQQVMLWSGRMRATIERASAALTANHSAPAP